MTSLRYEHVKQGVILNHKGMRQVFKVTRKRGGYLYLRVLDYSSGRPWKLSRCRFNDLGFTKVVE